LIELLLIVVKITMLLNNEGEFRMKKFVGVALAAILAFSMLGLLAGCDKGADDIANITVGSQESNGVTMSNYTVRLKDSVDWPSLSDGDREKIAKVGYDQAQEKREEAGTHNYNIIGITADGQAAFQFDRENNVIIIYVNDAKAAEISVEVPAL
jgi:hypothetical protein